MGNEASSAQDENSMPLASPTRAIDSEVRRRLARGVQYNMKIVIRGDRNTGKTQLWRRLQGQHFTAAYTPTEQIQIATINWNYKATSDVVKLDAWDVVDRAPKRKNQAGMTDSGLKIANTEAYDASELNGDEDGDQSDNDTIEGANPLQNEFGIGSVAPMSPGAAGSAARTPRSGSYSVAKLDATTVDVMRGATGCVMMFDMTKRWTWEYVTRELPKVAKKGIHVLVVGNFRDMGASGRVVSEATAAGFCAVHGDNVHYLEASMKNGYGVRAIATFFSLPFLALQKRYLDEQLRRNSDETGAALQEMKALSEDLTYEMYLKQLADRKAAAATATPPPQQPPKQPPKQQAPAAAAVSETAAKKQKEESPTSKAEEAKAAARKEQEKEAKQRALEEQRQKAAAKVQEDERKKRAKEEEKRYKEEERKQEEYNRKHAKEIAEQQQKQAAMDAAAAEELKKLAASTSSQSRGTAAAKGASLASIDDFKVTAADTDGWLAQKTRAAAAADSDDGWLVTPEGKQTGTADPFAFGADDDDEDEEEVQKASTKTKKGKKSKHKQAFLADDDDGDF